MFNTLKREIEELCARGGPEPHQFTAAAQLVYGLWALSKIGHFTTEDARLLREAAGAAMEAGTMQGRGYLKKHGYTGDFEFIDEMYRTVMTDDPMLRRWDEFFHSTPPPKAVRNRKTYCQSLLRQLLHEAPPVNGSATVLQVLNIASGPCRDLLEFFDAYPDAPFHVTCLDSDAKAIAYAKSLCAAHLHKLTFIRGNAFKFHTDARFDLIWSAGLFDYFDDAGFVTLLTQLKGFAKPGAEVVIGNFVDRPGSPGRAYLELVGGWMLNYRDEPHLQRLAEAAGFTPNAIRIEQEPEGINLFLRASA